VPVEQLGFGALPVQNEVGGKALVVMEEIILDGIGPVTQRQEECLVPEGCVIFHQVPEDGAVAYGYHGLGNVLGILAQAHAQTAAEQDDFHDGPFSRPPPLSVSRPWDKRVAAARTTAGNRIPARSAMSESERDPSERLRTQSMAMASAPGSGRLPTALYRPRLPSWGSQKRLAFRNVPSHSRTPVRAINWRRDSPREAGFTKSGLSAEVLYSGKRPCGVGIRQPAGKSNPGEQNCRSSYPNGEKSSTE